MKILRGMIIVVLLLAVVLTVSAKGGPPGDPGEPPDTGELFGDLYVIDRELVNGMPVYDIYEDVLGEKDEYVTVYCVRPISSATDTVTNSVTDVAVQLIEGEPFELFTYYDSATETQYACELLPEFLPYVQEVDFGRMNVGRSPELVLLHSFDEAINTMNSADEMRLGPAGRIQLHIPDEEGVYYWKTIDSPLENLGLYLQLMLEGHWLTPENTIPETRGNKPDGKGPPEGDGPSSDPRPVLTELARTLLFELGFPHLALLDDNGSPVLDEEGNEVAGWHTPADLDSSELMMAANLMSGAADKGSAFTIDKVVYLNSIYGINSLSNSLVVDAAGKTYFNFGNAQVSYQRSFELGNEHRWVDQCFDVDAEGVVTHRPGEAWVLGFEGVTGNGADTAWDDLFWKAGCINVRGVVFAGEDQQGSDIVGFAKAATDAIGILTYVHNYHVPEDLGDDYPILNPPPESLQSLASHPLMPTPR